MGPYSTSFNIFQLQSFLINLYQLLSTSANICQPQSTLINHLSIFVNLSQSHLNSPNLVGTKYHHISFCQIITTSVNLFQLLSIYINFFQPLPTSVNVSKPQLTSLKLIRFHSNSTNLGGPYSTSIYVFQL